MRRTTMGLLGLCLAAMALAGCSDDADTASEPSTGAGGSSSASSPSASGSSEPAGGGQSVDITFSGDSVEPLGERIDVALGEPLTLNVSADAAGELHVHSTPEQELAYEAGETTLELTIDEPGVVEVESHDLELTILQLEVR